MKISRRRGAHAGRRRFRCCFSEEARSSEARRWTTDRDRSFSSCISLGRSSPLPDLHQKRTHRSRDCPASFTPKSARPDSIFRHQSLSINLSNLMLHLHLLYRSYRLSVTLVTSTHHLDALLPNTNPVFSAFLAVSPQPIVPESPTLRFAGLSMLARRAMFARGLLCLRQSCPSVKEEEYQQKSESDYFSGWLDGSRNTCFFCAQGDRLPLGGS